MRQQKVKIRNKLVTSILLLTVIVLSTGSSFPKASFAAPEAKVHTAKKNENVVSVFLHSDGHGRVYRINDSATLSDLLEREKIEIGENDFVSMPLDTKLEDRIFVKIHRVEQTFDVKKEKVPFESARVSETVSCDDDETEKIITDGSEGERTKVSVITQTDAKTVKELVKNGVTEEPQDEVIAPCEEDAAIDSVSIDPPSVQINGTSLDWMKAAGIPEEEWMYVDYIVSKESGWNPNIVNSSSGACGLAQSLPCDKSEVYGSWNDPVAQLQWQYDYVRQRYGSYQAAYEWWISHNWY